MHPPLRWSPETIYPLLDWFVPAPLKAEYSTLRRARIFLVSHFFGPFLGHTITVYLYWLDPKPGYALGVLAAAISVYWLFPWLLKVTGALTPLALVSVAHLVFIIYWGCYCYGGVSSPFFGWLVVVPLLAFLYLDSLVPRLVVLGLIGCGTVAFLDAVAHGTPQHVPLRALSGIGTVSIISAAIYVSMMAVYYANIVASQSELEREVKSHRATAAKLQEAREGAESANYAKSDFAAKMSHELRTPLNAIIGYSEMLLEDIETGDEQARQDLQNINTSGKNLLAIISDVLDLSKIEAGKMELVREQFGLRALIESVVQSVQPLCAKNRNQLVVECADDVRTAEGDPTRLRQVLLNILSNAAKFTEDGRVVLRAQCMRERDGTWLKISVLDTGIGIARENLGKLFENFSQVDPSASAKHGGTGLGLALTRKLCRLMGGDVTVESERGKGSCFTICVPAFATDVEAAAVDAGIGAGRRPTATHGRTTVIVDDGGVAAE